MVFFKVTRWGFAKTPSLLLFLLLSCCIGRQEHPILVRADSLMIFSPDSALLLLESLDPNEISIPVSKARYALLLTQARDKNYILHDHDSLIRIAVAYYDSIGDVGLRAKSHYYLGRVYQDKKDYVAAAREFLITLPLARVERDSNLIYLSQGNLGHIYYQQGLYDKADSLYRIAEELTVQRGDSSNLVMVLAARAYICMVRGVAFDEKAQRLLERASLITHLLGDKSVEAVVTNALGTLYESLDSVSLLCDYVEKGMSVERSAVDVAGYYLLQGSAFYKLGEYDSATFYLQKSLLTDSHYTMAGAYLRLSDVSEKLGLLADALHYKNCYLNYLDSIKWKEKKYATQILSLEDEAKVQSHIEYYQTFLAKYRLYVYVLLACLLLGVSLGVYRRRKYSKKSESLICENTLLERKLNDMEHIQDELRQKEAQISLLQERLGDQVEDKRKLYLLNEQCAFLRNQKETLFVVLLSDSVSYKLLSALLEQKKKDAKCKQHFSDEDWNVLLKDINRFSNGFIDRLAKQYELLNTVDIRFCCLVRIGLSYTDIALVFDRSLDAMYKKRNGIIEHKIRVAPKSHLLEDILKTF